MDEAFRSGRMVQYHWPVWPLAILHFVDLKPLHTLLWFTTTNVETNMIMKDDICERKCNTLIMMAHTVLLKVMVQFKTESTLLIFLSAVPLCEL